MFSAYFLTCKARAAEKIFAAVNIPVELAYMAFTRARTYILVLAVSLVILVFYSMHRKIQDKRKLRLVYLALTVLFLLGGYILIFTKYGMGRNIAEFSFNGYTFKDLGTMPAEERDQFLNRFTSARWMMWKECLGVIRQSPIYGYGIKSAGFTYFVNKGYNAHNLFINSMLFSGLIGTVWMCIMLFAFLKDSVKNCFNPQRTILWVYAFGNVLIAQLETGLLYNGKATVAICWALWGLLTCMYDLHVE